MGDRHAGPVSGHAGVPAGDGHRGYGDRGGCRGRRYHTTKIILVELRLGLWLGVHRDVRAGLVPGWNLVVGQGVRVLVGLGNWRLVGCRHVWLVGRSRGVPGRTQLLPGWLGFGLLGEPGFLGSRLILRLLAWGCRASRR